MKKYLAGVVLIAAAAWPAVASAQSLGEAARREAERRAQAKEATKVYTADDLKSAAIKRPVPGAPAGTKPAAQPEAAKDAAKDDKPAAEAEAAGQAAAAAKADLPKPREKRDEQHWRERAQVIRDRLNRLRSDSTAIEGRIAALQLELESASSSRAPALAKELDQASQDLARFRSDLALIEEEWSKFEDRARQAKVPPAWIY